MSVPALVAQWWPYLVVGAPGLFALWKSFQGGFQAKRRDRADLVRIAQDAAGAVIEDLRAEIERGNHDREQLRGRLEEVEAELADLRREHIRMIADKDAEIALLKGDNRQLRTIVEGLQRLLKAHGIDPPAPSQQYWIVMPGDDPNEIREAT